MEWVIVLMLLVLIFKDEIIELKQSLKDTPEKEKTEREQRMEAEKEQRKEEFEHELNNIMDYSINKAIDSKSKKE